MKNIIKILFISVLISVGISALAQAPPPPPGNPRTGGGGSDGPVGAPIDGGLGILLALGAAYGGKRLLKTRKKTKGKSEAWEK